MRINNVSYGTSKQGIVKISVILFFVLIGLVVLFYFWTPVQVFQMIWNMDDWFLKLVFEFAVFVLPILLVCGLVSEIEHRKEMLTLLNRGFNLKYIDFLNGRINFCFADPKYNFTCGCNDIESLCMNLKTTKIVHKSETRIVLNEVELTFKVLNGKTFSISNTPLLPTRFIYKLIDYTRGIQNFSYKFSEAGVSKDLKEKLDDYYQRGCKQILSTEQENSFKFMSIGLFGISAYFVFIFWNEIIRAIEKSDWIYLFVPFTPITMLIMVVCVLDVFLIVDKIHDRKYHIHHDSDELIGKIPCEIIIAAQVIIVAAFVFMLCKLFILPY